MDDYKDIIEKATALAAQIRDAGGDGGLKATLNARRAALHDELHAIVGRIQYEGGIPTGTDFSPADFQREREIRAEVTDVQRALAALGEVERATRAPSTATLQAEGADFSAPVP